MKKILFAVTVFLYCLLITTSSHAQTGITVPQEVKQSFAGEFKNSQYERWVKVHDMYVATFTDGNNTWKDAYFSEEGEFKGVGRYITTDMLPMFVSQSLKDRYSNFEVFELYQYECQENGLCYFVVLRNDKNQVIAKLSSDGEVAYSQKTKLKGAKTPNNDIALTKNQ